MKFKYIGGGADSPLVTNIFGYTFILNGPANEIKEKAIQQKLSGNTTFEAQFEDAPEAAAEPDAQPLLPFAPQAEEPAKEDEAPVPLAMQEAPAEESKEPTYREKVEFILSKGVQLKGRTPPQVNSQYKALMSA